MAEFEVYLRCVVYDVDNAAEAEEAVIVGCEDMPASVYVEKVVGPVAAQPTSASSASEAARSLHSPETGDPR